MDSLVALSAQSGDTSFLTVRRGGRSVCLHREDGDFQIRTQALQAGDRHPLGVGAGAMAIFAALPPAEREATLEEIAPILAQSHPNYTPEVLRAHAVLTNERGWSLNPGLSIANSWAVGVALFAPGGVVIGALSIAAIEQRMGPDRQIVLAEMLKHEAARTEARLRRRLDFDGVV
jgi:DNA-binding IclR family transcriptional regulator